MNFPMTQDWRVSGESEQMEWKAKVNLPAIGETVAAFLNTAGGRLVVGMDDNGQVLGVQDAPKALTRIRNYLDSTLTPNALWDVKVEEIEGKNCLVIDVPPGSSPPYLHHDTIFVRTGTHTVRANPEKISSLIFRQSTTQTRWERQPAPGAGLTDLDKAEILYTASEAGARHLSKLSNVREPLQILESLHLIQEGMLLNSAIVLFANDPTRYYPQTRVRVASFTSEDQINYEDNRILEGNIFSLINQIADFFNRNITITSRLIEGGYLREDRPTYPGFVLREAVMNALVHRDYAAFDGSVTILLYPNRLEIWNPGTLPDGVAIESLSKGIISRPHNPDIAYVFFLRGLIDRVGSGIRRIVAECLAAGLPEPQWAQESGGIKLTIWSTLEERSKTDINLSPRLINFLQATREGERFSLSIYRQFYAPDVTDRSARSDLAKLVSLGYLHKEGGGAKTVYARTGKTLTR